MKTPWDLPGMRSLARAIAGLVLVGGAPGCTIYHSRQAVTADLAHVPPPTTRFVTEEDSGLLLFGIVSLSEPDHFAVLLERARRRYKCGSLTQAQLDFYTEHWLLVGFSVARLTALCEPANVPDVAERK